MNKVDVLIVDDHFLFRNGLEAVLRKIECVNKVYQCENGIEVLDTIEDFKIGLVFMDVRIPGENGIQLTQRITSRFTGMKIIALSMFDDKATIDSMFRSGAVGYLIKSCSFNELELAISNVLGGNRYISKDLPQFLINNNYRPIRNAVQRFEELFTKRERDILRLICQGFSNKEASVILGISLKAIEAYKTRLFEKTGVKNATSLVKYSYEHQLINLL